MLEKFSYDEIEISTVDTSEWGKFQVRPIHELGSKPKAGISTPFPGAGGGGG